MERIHFRPFREWKAEALVLDPVLLLVQALVLALGQELYLTVFLIRVLQV